MPVIPLKKLSYEDANDMKRVIDALNANFRYLDWLLNHQNLDLANLKPEIIQIQPADPEKPQPVDPYGLNPEYFKYYPNKCWNSSFEVFDPATFKPKYWDTAGVVSPDANFDSTYSLKLAPGQYAQQAEADGEGLADPGWWPWCPETRISFRVKGAGGKVRVQVIQSGAAVPLWIWVRDARGNWVKSRPAPEIVFDAAPDWPTALRTFAAQTLSAGGKIALRFENVGTADVYIDAVTIEPDWTGKWPSFYTHGPKSLPEPRVEGGHGLILNTLLDFKVFACLETGTDSPETEGVFFGDTKLGDVVYILMQQAPSVYLPLLEPGAYLSAKFKLSNHVVLADSGVSFLSVVTPPFSLTHIILKEYQSPDYGTVNAQYFFLYGPVSDGRGMLWASWDGAFAPEPQPPWPNDTLLEPVIFEFRLDSSNAYALMNGEIIYSCSLPSGFLSNMSYLYSYATCSGGKVNIEEVIIQTISLGG